MELPYRISHKRNRKMKNTKQKLELLNNKGFGQVIKDFCILTKNEISNEKIHLNILKLESKYLLEIDEENQLKNQLKLKFNE